MTPAKEADRLWTLAVRRRWPRCLECGGRDSLQSAHLISRRYHATRHLLTNGVTLCRAHHKFYTERPLEWLQWCAGHFPDVYENLRQRALSYQKPDYEVLLPALRMAAAAP